MNNIYNAKELHILAYAAEEFSAEGFVGGSTNTIAKKANVAKGLIFHYFGSKEKLFVHTLQYAFEMVASSINQEVQSLSTFMDAFDLMRELLQAKHTIVYREPLYAPLLFDSFHSTTGYSDTLLSEITRIKAEYDTIYTSFLDSVFLQERLRAPYKNDDELFHKLFIMLETVFVYEIAKIEKPLDSKKIKKISLVPYIKMFKNGILLQSK